MLFHILTYFKETLIIIITSLPRVYIQTKASFILLMSGKTPFLKRRAA